MASCLLGYRFLLCILWPKCWIGHAGFWITFQLLFSDKGGMEVSQQHMNMVFVLGSKETIRGYNLAGSSVIKFQISFLFPYFYKFTICLQSKEEKYFINNHLSFRVMYHKDSETDAARIVGFEVTPNRCCSFLLCRNVCLWLLVLHSYLGIT